MKYLDKINSPEDLKKLNKSETVDLCREIRETLVDRVTKNGGHLSSNLGVVELSVAIHRVFDSPKDKIIFDVGHQSYVHKLLTGRRDCFEQLRVPGGLSGFTNREESPHDPFGAGHSSTSLSAALGFAEANALQNGDSFAVAVIGDGAYTGGMIHEALNNCKPNLKLVIILNENGMSISKNRGSFAKYLTRVRVSNSYMRFKRRTKTVLHKIPLIGRSLEKVAGWIHDRLVNLFYPLNYFENLGLYYIGVIDGNNEEAVEAALTKAKELGKTTVVHLRTKKGLGYEPAEAHPDLFHGLNKTNANDVTFHTVFADEICKLSETDEKIVAVTAAMGQGTGLDTFGLKYPDRMFDVGIAEEHELTFCAGLSAAGLHPYAVIYSTFLQRAFDNVCHDVALQNLPLRIMIDRAGLAVCDGATHHGIFDVALLSEIPAVSILSPATFGSLRAMLSKPYPEGGKVEAIRYSNSEENPKVREAFYPNSDYENFGVRTNFGKEEKKDILFITYGKIVENVLTAEESLRKNGRSVGTILLEKLTPYEKIASEILPLMKDAKHVIFVEEGIKNGGAGVNLGAALTQQANGQYAYQYDVLALEDFPKPKTLVNLYDFVGLSPEKIMEFTEKKLL